MEVSSSDGDFFLEKQKQQGGLWSQKNVLLGPRRVGTHFCHRKKNPHEDMAFVVTHQKNEATEINNDRDKSS